MAAVTVTLSLYTEGNRPERTNKFASVGDVLKDSNISTTDCVLELLGTDGKPKDCSVNTVFVEGDYLNVMKKSNKSG